MKLSLFISNDFSLSYARFYYNFFDLIDSNLFLDLYKYSSKKRNATLMKKYNMIYHIKGSHLKNKRKDTIKGNKKCNFCGAEFVKKSNRDRHIKNIHGDEPAAALLSQKENNNEGRVSSQGNANDCEEDPNISGSNALPLFIVFSNEDSDEDIESGEERDERNSNWCVFETKEASYIKKW